MLNPIVNSKIGCSAITRCAGLAATCKFSGRLTGYQDPAILYATLKSQIHCQYNISPCSVHGYRSDSGCSCTGNPWLPSLLPQQRSRLGKSSPLQRILFPLLRSQPSMHSRTALHRSWTAPDEAANMRFGLQRLLEIVERNVGGTIKISRVGQNARKCEIGVPQPLGLRSHKWKSRMVKQILFFPCCNKQCKLMINCGEHPVFQPPRFFIPQIDLELNVANDSLHKHESSSFVSPLR